MSNILAFVASKFGALLGGVGIGAALLLVTKFVPKWIDKFLGDELLVLLNPHTADPKEAALIHAVVFDLVRLAEYKIPDRGHGAERYQAVANTLAAFCPILRGQENKIEGLIETAVAEMDDQLKKFSDKWPPPGYDFPTGGK